MEEVILDRMNNPKYKKLFDLVSKRGLNELKESHPELIDQIRKELILSGINTDKLKEIEL